MHTQMSRILEIANENPTCWLATVDDICPRLRPMQMWFADVSGFYFHTGKRKNIFRQLIGHPMAEAAFSTKNGEIARVSGDVEILADPALTERLFRERPWVIDRNDATETETDIAIFRIVRGTAILWTSDFNAKENEIPKVQF